jgi:hypothetical protein
MMSTTLSKYFSISLNLVTLNVHEVITLTFSEKRSGPHKSRSYSLPQ